MSDDAANPNPKIKIDRVWITRGGPVDDHNLMGCYFEPGDLGQYHFFGKHDDLIPTIPDVLTSELMGFQFIRDGILWTVSAFHLDEEFGVATGHWSNTRGTDDDDGEFHAQSGPGAEEESASSATA